MEVIHSLMWFPLWLFNPYAFYFLDLPGYRSPGNSSLVSILFVWQWGCPVFVYFPLQDLIQLEFASFHFILGPSG